MATLATEPGLRSRTRGRISGSRERWIVQSSVQLRGRARQWPWVALLAAASLLVSAALSYHWRPAGLTPARTSGSVLPGAGWQAGSR